MTVRALMPHRMDSHPVPRVDDGETNQQLAWLKWGDERRGEVDAMRYFAWFRSSIRYALWPLWPNNLGVGDDEIIEAVRRIVDELVERQRADDGGMIAPNKATLFNMLSEWAEPTPGGEATGQTTQPTRAPRAPDGGNDPAVGGLH